MIRIAHSADFHACRGRMDEVLASVATLRETAERESVDLIAIAGDLWQSGMYATGASRFPEYIEAIRSLADVAPVVMIYGTPSHDLAGSLDVFEQLVARHPITILQPGTPHFLQNGAIYEEGSDSNDALMIFGIPEPTKEWLLAGVPAMGTEATEQAIKTGMKQLFLGLAAQRKEHIDIPCLVLYHGQIVGATMQNERQIQNGQGIAIGRDDLAMIGADYYALGDIHEPQQIGDLPMYYPGSAYPINWGETHQAGFNLVDIHSTTEPQPEREPSVGPPSFFIDIDRIDYPHPRKVTVRVEAERVAATGGIEFDTELTDAMCVGKKVRLEITTRREVAAEIKLDRGLEALKNLGALDGSEVTLNILPTETVRAGEISEAEGLREKVGIYAENSFQEIALTVLDKADQLETAAGSNGAGRAGAHIRITRLHLRGAIGIWKGQHKDEIDINLDDYDEGLVALLGPNGAGKTTLIENMHPWPQMLTRDGVLTSHFRLRDSFRELHFADERTGDTYRALIQINGSTKTGGMEYHLWKNEQPLVNGRKDPYVEAVTEIFGSLELYQRSAFVSQRPTKGNPDLADATKGERKQLFRELAGLDYLQEYAEAAKERAKALTEEISGDQGWITATEEAVGRLPALKQDRKVKLDELAHAKTTVETTAETEKNLDTELTVLAEKLTADRQLREKAAEIETQIDGTRQTIGELKAAREIHGKTLAGKVDAQERIDNYEELEDDRKKLEAAKATKLQARNTALEIYNARLKTVRDARDKLTDEKRVVERSRDDLQQKRTTAKETIDRLGDQLAEERHDKCPECKALLPWAEAEEERRVGWQGQLEAAQQLLWKIDKELPEIEDSIETHAANIAKLIDPDEPKQDKIIEDDELTRIAGDIDYLNVDEARRIVSEAAQAAVRIEEAGKQIDILTAQIKTATVSLEEISSQLDEEIAQWVATARQDLDIARCEAREATNAVAGIEAELGSLNNQVTDLEERAQELKERKAAVAVKQNDAAEWSWLQKACGPDGIQALELDALAPSIEEVANRLLQSAYGSRFLVRFETTKMDARGKKQLEDFLIQIHDTEHGTEQELATLSGGESTWIKRALYDAFGIIRARNTGIQFLTVFTDESDGALDPDAREKYFRMLEAAHIDAGRSHTIVITQSREVQEMVRSQINMEELSEANTAGERLVRAG